MKAFLQSKLRFKGELHQVRLVNFSVHPEEIAARLPHPLKARKMGNKALISMVDVQLRNMRLAQFPLLRFHYRHIAFRLLVEDAQWNRDGQHHGIHFLQSFTDRPMLGKLGNAMSPYQFEASRLEDRPHGLRLSSGQNFLEYEFLPLPNAHLGSGNPLFEMVRNIDRAWSVEGDKLLKTQIMREQWPIQAVEVGQFHTNFFESAKLEAIYIVPQVIHYQWLPARQYSLSPQFLPETHEISIA
jgi:hypothetical protein